MLDFFNTYIAWAKSSVSERGGGERGRAAGFWGALTCPVCPPLPCPQLRRDVARCKPIAQTLDNAEAITCDYLLDSLVSGATRLWGGRCCPHN